jgi:hypothetical protein
MRYTIVPDFQERQSELENTTISASEQKPEELFEDPF